MNFLHFDKYWPIIEKQIIEKIRFYPSFMQKIQLLSKNRYYRVQWQPCILLVPKLLSTIRGWKPAVYGGHEQVGVGEEFGEEE